MKIKVLLSIQYIRIHRIVGVVDLHGNERKPFERKEKTKNAPDDFGKGNLSQYIWSGSG